MCASIRREASKKAASKRYQNTRRGKLKHAARQRRYRERKKQETEKVTHHTSNNTSPNDLIPDKQNEYQHESSEPKYDEIYCHFCNVKCSSYLRLNFLKRNSFGKNLILTSWPSGP